MAQTASKNASRHRPCVARHRSSVPPPHGTGTTAVLEERISDATEGHNDRTRECVNGICFHSGHCRGARTGPVTRLQKGGPLSRASSCSADRLTGAISLRYPHVRQASIDKQADGARPGDTVSGGPEFDAFEHLDRETDFDFGAYGCVNGGHVSPSIVDVGFEDEMKCAKLCISRLLELQVAAGQSKKRKNLDSAAGSTSTP